MFCTCLCTYICWLHTCRASTTPWLVFAKKKLKSMVKGIEIKPVTWEFESELERFDLLYVVHYPDPEKEGKHRRSFGGDVVQATEGSNCAVFLGSIRMYLNMGCQSGQKL